MKQEHGHTDNIKPLIIAAGAIAVLWLVVLKFDLVVVNERNFLFRYIVISIALGFWAIFKVIKMRNNW
ncbi:MAG: hypothetical protein AB3N28_15705 [Kordiimonas sp.]